MKLNEKDHTALTQFQADYSRLLEKWKNARPYSQEAANVDVMFKSLERRIGAAVGDGLFQRILDAAGVGGPQGVQCEAAHAPRGLCEFGPYGWRGVVVCKHCKQAPPAGVKTPLEGRDG